MDEIAYKLTKKLREELLTEGVYTFDTEVGREFRVFVKLWEEIAENHGKRVTRENFKRMIERAKRKAQEDFPSY